MAKFSVGDTVMLHYVNARTNPWRPVTVEKVGVKNVYVLDGARRLTFDAENGLQKNDAYNHHRIMTVPDWEAEQAFDRVIEGLRKHGVRLEKSSTRAIEIPYDKLMRILAILDEEVPDVVDL